MSNFPTHYSLAIRIAILNCYANIEHMANCGSDRYYDDPEDEKAVEYCYNSLYGIDTPEAILVRKRYLTEKIATASYVHSFDLLYHPGSTFRKIREDWNKAKFEEFTSHENIDFKQLVETLRCDFIDVIQSAEAKGAFDEDEKQYQESWRKFFQEMNDIPY